MPQGMLVKLLWLLHDKVGSPIYRVTSEILSNSAIYIKAWLCTNGTLQHVLDSQGKKYPITFVSWLIG